MTSLMFSSPVEKRMRRSKPRPNPAVEAHTEAANEQALAHRDYRDAEQARAGRSRSRASMHPAASQPRTAAAL